MSRESMGKDKGEIMEAEKTLTHNALYLIVHAPKEIELKHNLFFREYYEAYQRWHKEHGRKMQLRHEEWVKMTFLTVMLHSTSYQYDAKWKDLNNSLIKYSEVGMHNFNTGF